MLKRTPSVGHASDLTRFEPFHHLDARVLSTLAASASKRALAAGETLWRQGATDCNSAFFVISGSVAVHCKSEARTSERDPSPASLPRTPAENTVSREGTSPDAHRTSDSASKHTAEKEAGPAHRRPDAPASPSRARLGGSKTYVGMYVPTRYPVVREPEDHGPLLFKHHAGATIGCLSALTGCARFETAVAEGQCALFEIPSEQYKALLASKEEKKYSADCLFLRNVPCFRSLPDDVLVRVAASFHRVSHPSKIDVCRQGTTAVAMHLVRSGECELVRRVKLPRPELELGRAAERGKVNLHLADLGRTDIIGHYELLSEKVHSFSVTTKTDVELWSLTSEALETLCHHFAKEHGTELKRLTKDLLEHGKLSDTFHRQRASQTGAARWDEREKMRAKEFAEKQARETPQWRAEEAAASKATSEKDRQAGNFTSVLEAGPGLVGRVLGTKVYTRVVELQPRIHPLLLIPLSETQRRLPHVLSKRKKIFAEPVRVDLIPAGLAGAGWESRMDFEVPFEGPAQKYSTREVRIHDQLHFAVNMFTAYSAMAMDRIFRSAKDPKLASKGSRMSRQLPAQSKSTSGGGTVTGKQNLNHGSAGGRKKEWIDLQSFLSLLEGANLVVRDETLLQHNENDSTPHDDSRPIKLSTLVRESSELQAKNLVQGLDTATPPSTSVQQTVSREVFFQTSISEKIAIRIFLSSLRRLRDSTDAPERSISFEHFLGCLRSICHELDCKPLERLKDAAHAKSEIPDIRTTKQAVPTDSAGTRDRPLDPADPGARSSLPAANVWQSPLLLRQSLAQQQSREQSIDIRPHGVRHHGIKLRRVLQSPTSPQDDYTPDDVDLLRNHASGHEATADSFAHSPSPVSLPTSPMVRLDASLVLHQAYKGTKYKEAHLQSQALRSGLRTPPMIDVKIRPQKDLTLAPTVSGFRSSGISRERFLLQRGASRDGGLRSASRDGSSVVHERGQAHHGTLGRACTPVDQQSARPSASDDAMRTISLGDSKGRNGARDSHEIDPFPRSAFIDEKSTGSRRP